MLKKTQQMRSEVVIENENIDNIIFKEIQIKLELLSIQGKRKLNENK